LNFFLVAPPTNFRSDFTFTERKLSPRDAHSLQAARTNAAMRYALARRCRQMGRVDWYSRQETICHCVLCGRLVRMDAAGEVGLIASPGRGINQRTFSSNAGLHRHQARTTYVSCRLRFRFISNHLYTTQESIQAPNLALQDVADKHLNQVIVMCEDYLSDINRYQKPFNTLIHTRYHTAGAILCIF